MYLNDLEEYISVEYKGLSHITDLVHKFLDSEETSTFLRLYLLLYADDNRRIPVGASKLIFAPNTYLFVFRWYFRMTKIIIEVIDISRQISLVNRSRDHSTIIEKYLQYYNIANTTKMRINKYNEMKIYKYKQYFYHFKGNLSLLFDKNS